MALGFGCIVLHCLFTGNGFWQPVPNSLCCSVAKLHFAPSPTLSNRWRHACLRMLQKAATAILREPSRIMTDTKGHHTLRLDGQFEDCDESEEEAVLLMGFFRMMKVSVLNLDKPPRTCKRCTLQRVRQALIPYRPKPLVFKPTVGRARCGTLFNLRDVGGATCEVALHATIPRPRSFVLSFVWMPPLFGRQVPHVGRCISI